MNFKEWMMSEMPMTRLDLKGRWEPNAPGYGYNKQDVGILSNPRGVDKIKQAWSNTKQDYEVYFLRSREGSKHIEVGEVTPEWVKTNLQLDVPRHDEAITIIFTNNRGDQKVPMTAWIIAHRMGHAIRRDDQFQQYFAKEIERDFRELAKEVFGMNMPKQDWGRYTTDDRQLKALASAVGTMNSARNSNLRNFNEFTYELLAQYIITGRIKFNPIPRSLITRNRMAWGRPAPEMRHSRLDPEAHEEWNEMLMGYADKYEHYLDSVLSGMVGNIYVM